MINKAAIIVNKIGIIAFAIDSNGTFPTVDATNKLTPNGGVTNPIARFITRITPKWTGSIPIEVTTGSNIGVKITIDEIVSINIPTISRNILMIKMITSGLSDTPTIKSATITGILSFVIKKANDIENPIIITVAAFVSAASEKLLYTAFKSRDRKSVV